MPQKVYFDTMIGRGLLVIEIETTDYESALAAMNNITKQFPKIHARHTPEGILLLSEQEPIYEQCPPELEPKSTAETE